MLSISAWHWYASAVVNGISDAKTVNEAVVNTIETLRQNHIIYDFGCI